MMSVEQEHKENKDMLEVARDASIEHNLDNIQVSGEGLNRLDRDNEALRDAASTGNMVTAENNIDHSGARLNTVGGAISQKFDDDPSEGFGVADVAAAPAAAIAGGDAEIRKYTQDEIEAADRYNIKPEDVTQAQLEEHKEEEVEEESRLRKAVSEVVSAVSGIAFSGEAYASLQNMIGDDAQHIVSNLASVPGGSYACGECQDANSLPTSSPAIAEAISTGVSNGIAS